MTNPSYTISVYLDKSDYEALMRLTKQMGKPRNLVIRDLIKKEAEKGLYKLGLSDDTREI